MIVNLLNNKSPCKAIGKDPYLIRFVDNPSEKLCLMAVNKKGRALREIKIQTEKVCLAAVKNDGFALEYVKKQTDEICLAAVKQAGFALRFVKNQTFEICWAAVRCHKKAINFIRSDEYKLQIKEKLRKFPKPMLLTMFRQDIVIYKKDGRIRVNIGSKDYDINTWIEAGYEKLCSPTREEYNESIDKYLRYIVKKYN